MTGDRRRDLDIRFMRLALELGRRGLGETAPNPSVGAVLVRDEGAGPVIVGRGRTQAGGRPHAETEALRRAGERARGATLYVTLEPCAHYGKTPPCTDAVIAAGVARVVAAMPDPDLRVAGRGFTRLAAAGIAVEQGVCIAEARHDHAGHVMRVVAGRPFVTLKLAVSREGAIAAAGRRRVQLSGPPANARTHLMRAASDAIAVGVGTVIADDPLLTCRLPGMEDRSPDRIVFDARLEIPDESQLLATARTVPTTIVATEAGEVAREKALRHRGATVLRVASTREGRIDLKAALSVFGTLGMTRLFVEGGARIAGELVAADLVDEAILIRTGIALGEGALPAFAPRGLSMLTEGALRLASAEQVGDDILETYRRG